MANVTFRSPVLAKDKTVYAVAGDRGTLLALAKAHSIPIPFDCGDGECGSCLVQVKVLSGRPMGVNMQEKEKEVLRQLGLVSKAELAAAETDDVPTGHRLACQTIVRNEDILVTFAGDETLPAKRPALSSAAGTFKGGIEISSVEMFLAYAIKVEEEAARHFEELAADMRKSGNGAVAQLFDRLGGYARLHLAEAKTRADGFAVEAHLPEEHQWPTLETPEQTSLWAGDASMTVKDALRAALDGERRGFDFYHHIAETTKDPKIRDMARAFVKEEAEHVGILERWIAADGQGSGAPLTG
jgi:rubrerythrin/ferredoxin